MQAADLVDQSVGQVQSVAAARSASKYERQQLVVAEPGRAEALQLLTRAIVRRDGFHLYSNSLCVSPRGSPVAAWLAIVVSTIACAAPSQREIDQAQGAIDAARAAGAERYAPTEFAAATQALKQANEAVTGRDYRLALNYALESREQAQNAATSRRRQPRASSEATSSARSPKSKALIAQTQARVDGPSGAQIPRGTRRTAQQRLKQLEGDLQKADAALQAEEYMEAERLLMGVKQRIEEVAATLSRGSASQSPRRRG